MVGHLLDLGGAGEAVLDDLLADLRDRQAAAVVGDAQDDVAALVPRLEADAPRLRLARGPPLLRPLDAVVERVADHVRQRILDQLQHLPVELCLRPGLLRSEEHTYELQSLMRNSYAVL